MFELTNNSIAFSAQGTKKKGFKAADLMFKMYPSKRKLANERTNGKISPETQVLAHWKSDIFLRAIFRRSESVLDYLEA